MSSTLYDTQIPPPGYEEATVHRNESKPPKEIQNVGTKNQCCKLKEHLLDQAQVEKRNLELELDNLNHQLGEKVSTRVPKQFFEIL